MAVFLGLSLSSAGVFFIIFVITRRFSVNMENLLTFFSRTTLQGEEKVPLSFRYSEFSEIARGAENMAKELKISLESRIKAEEERSLILNAVNEGILLLDKNCTILDVNPAAARMFKLKREEMIGFRCHERLCQENYNCEECNIGWLLEKRTNVYREIIGPSGEYFYESYTPIFQNDVLERIILVITDITDIKKKQEEVLRSEEDLRVTLSSIGDAVIATDRKGYITMMNPHACELTGWSCRNAMGLKVGMVYSVTHTITGEAMPNPVDTILAGGEKFTESKYTQLTSAGKEMIPVSHTASPILDNENRLTGVILVFRDITRENERNRQLAQAEFVLENSPEDIYFLDKGGRFCYANQKARESFGLDPLSLDSTTVFQVIPEINPDKFLEEQNTLMIEGELHREYSRQRSDGTVRYIDSRSFFITRGGDWIRCVFEHDITEKKRMETQLLQGRKMQAVGQLVGGIAHDFNNLLCGITGYSEVLSVKLKDNPPALKYANIIRRTASRASSLTGQLLSFSHNKEFNFEPIDIHKCINDTVRLLLRSIDKKILIQRKFNASKPVILGDPVQLQNAFLNLGINARDAMPSGGTIKITTDITSIRKNDRRSWAELLKPGEYLQISFQDTGVGIKPEITDKIFDPFFTTKEIGEGTGLGLAAVYGVIQKHAGDISVFSEPENGTEFRLLLPLNGEEPPAAETEEDPVFPEIKGKGTVLVVDDETVLTSLLQNFLEEQGFKVITAFDGKSGTEKYLRNKSDIVCVLLDIIMPVMDGYRAFEEMKKIDPSVKVIILSGFSGEEGPEKIKNLGAAAFIRKPYKMIELLSVMKEVIDGSGSSANEESYDKAETGNY